MATAFDSPGGISPVSKVPVVEVAVCCCEPVLRKVTVSPALIVTSGGLKPQELMSVALPSTICTSTSAAQVGMTYRMVSNVVPMRAAPSAQRRLPPNGIACMQVHPTCTRHHGGVTLLRAAPPTPPPALAKQTRP